HRQLGQDETPLVVRDDDLDVLRRQVVRLGNDPDAGLRTGRAAHDAGDIAFLRKDAFLRDGSKRGPPGDERRDETEHERKSSAPPSAAAPRPCPWIAGSSCPQSFALIFTPPGAAADRLPRPGRAPGREARGAIPFAQSAVPTDPRRVAPAGRRYTRLVSFGGRSPCLSEAIQIVR